MRAISRHSCLAKVSIRTHRTISLALFALFALAAAHPSAQVFSHKDGAENFEATVTSDHLAVKERYQGATTIYGDLSCPLGPAVVATLLPGADGRLCFTFATDGCKYTRFQDGEAVHKDELANTRVPRMCIVLATREDAQRLASLVNSGPQQQMAASDAKAPTPSALPAEAVAKLAEPISESRRTPPRPMPATQPASGSTRSGAEGLQMHSSEEPARPPRVDSAGQENPKSASLALFVHVRNPVQREEVERLVEPLSAHGIRLTGIKVMDMGPLNTDLRYFHLDDARRTNEVLAVLRKLGIRVPHVKHIKGFEARAVPQQYELWLSPTHALNGG
jgi:hypothetical protein